MGLFKRLGGLFKTAVGISTGQFGIAGSGIVDLLSSGKGKRGRPAPVPASQVGVKTSMTQTAPGVYVGNQYMRSAAPPGAPPMPSMAAGQQAGMPSKPTVPGGLWKWGRGDDWDLTKKVELEAVSAALAAGKGTTKRASIFKMLLREGALNNIVEEPLIFKGPDGRTKRGSYSGYILYNWYENGERMSVQVPKWLAEKFGLTRRKRKPVISVRESQAIRRAATAKKKAARVAKDAGLYVSMNRPKTSTTRRRR